MKISKYVPKLAFDNVVKKKNRTVLSFISVMLSSAIVFVSLTLFTTVFTLSKTLDNEALGRAHYYVEAEVFDNTNPLQFDVSYFSSPNENNVSYYYQADNATFFLLTEGVLPSSQNQILSYDKQIGDKVGEYTVVGIYEPTTIMLNSIQDFPNLSIDENLKTSINHYYIHDTNVHEEISITSVSNLTKSEVSHILQNADRITNDTILNYLQDTTTILLMFILIIAIAIFMCLVSIYNVLIVNDQDRRKEIGLLKSIGITRTELIAMLVLELTMIGFIAGIVGIILGMGISYLVLNTVLEQLKVLFSIGMIFNPVIVLIALVSGILLMDISGLLLYKKYFDSKPISDLKGEVVDYDIPYNADRFSITTVTWRMFVIYNERIKKQTKNLQRSFMLVMLTITLFCGIFVSNFLYQQRYNSVPDDFLIEVSRMTLGDKNIYSELTNPIYEIEDNTSAEFKDIYISRSIIGLSFSMPNDTFTDAYRTANKDDKPYNTQGVEWLNATHNGIILDDVQLNELKPYVTKGNLENLNENSTILIIYKYGTYSDDIKLRDVEVGTKVKAANLDLAKPFPNQYYSCDAVVELPFKELDLEYNLLTDYVFNIAFTEESFATLQGPSTTAKYEIHMSLENPTTHKECLNAITQIIYDTNNEMLLKLTDYIQIRNDGEFAVFLIEVLLYPLLLMLVIIGVININNVLKGNIHMKRTDFSTMKSVGMTSNQLSMIMTYEYAETYFNAGLMVFLLSIPLILFEKFVQIASTFKFADNFMGMFVMSFVIISPVIIISLAILSFKHLRNITALDGMKDVE